MAKQKKKRQAWQMHIILHLLACCTHNLACRSKNRMEEMERDWDGGMKAQLSENSQMRDLDQDLYANLSNGRRQHTAII